MGIFVKISGKEFNNLEVLMKKVIFEDLKHGDKVYRCLAGQCTKLYFVGKDPLHDDHYIFCNGTYLTSVIARNNSPSDWYTGKYDGEFIGRIQNPF